MRRLLVLLAVPLLALPFAAACTRLDADHCGNQADGDATCAARNGATPHCNVCVAANAGCVGGAPPDACSVASAQSTGGATDFGSTSYDGQSETSVGGSSSTTLEVSASGDTSSESGASESGAVDSGESTGGPPECGDGEIEGDEVCDGENFGGLTCALLNLEGGTLACLPGCLAFDLSGCDNFAICGNLMIEGNEDCDGVNVGGHNCLELPDFSGGQLACDATCAFNTTGCTPCKTVATSCGDPAECCSRGCTLGLCL